MRITGGTTLRRILIALSLLALGLVTYGQRFVRTNYEVSIPETSTSVRMPLSIPQMVEAVDNDRKQGVSSYMNLARAQSIQEVLKRDGDAMRPADRLAWELKYARELAFAGKTDESIQIFTNVAKQVKTYTPQAWSIVAPDVLMGLGISYMRRGEEQNCCGVNNAESCLVPIKGNGIHAKQQGSRQAIKCLLELLRYRPNDTAARWLLNVAYMTVGEYPSSVPSRWLIPLTSYGGEHPMKAFYNAAPDLGLDFLGWAGGTAMEDFDGDGLLDLMISSFRNGVQFLYFHNNGNGTFTSRITEAGLQGETGGLNFVTTDYNNDGKMDVILLRGGWLGKSGHYPLSLLRNDGSGHFTNVTLEAGLLTVGPTQTAVSFDYNGDGNLDLFVGYEARDDDPVPCKLFRNNGNGTFSDVTTLCGLNIVRFIKAAVSADFMWTGRPGLYLSDGLQTNILLRNDGPAGPDKSPMGAWRFTDISKEAGVDKQRGSFSCCFFDYDNDGWQDLYVGGYNNLKNVGDVANDYLGRSTVAEKARLYRNNGNGTFNDISRSVHLDKVILGMGLNFGDLDNDGWLDLYAGTGNPDLGMLIPNRMFRNREGKCFDEVTTTGGFGHLQKGHGIAFGDLDNNGQQDIFNVVGGALEADTAHDCLYVNPGNKNHWLTLKLRGVKSNRVAIGAEICVTVARPHGERKIYKTVGPGGSFGNNPLRQEIGLGDATAIKQVDIRWPASGIRQTVTGLGMDRFYKISEGDPNAEFWKLPSFKLPTGPSAAKARVSRR